jgi:hypothetical protein
MKGGSRAEVASSFTIVKGALINETYSALAAWDPTVSKRTNFARIRDDNLLGAGSATWARDVAKVLNRRFEPDGRDRALVVLAKSGCDLEQWKPLMLWHITRDEFLLRDFLENCLFPAFDAGALGIRSAEVESHLRGIAKRGAKTEHAWTEETTKRVAAGLLKMAADFGLLRTGAAKDFASYHLPEQSFLYLLHAVRDEKVSPGKVVAAADWRMFLMRPSDVEREILRLHQFRKLEYHVAGSLVELSLPCESSREYAERMVA